jgi:hypothetical protein
LFKQPSSNKFQAEKMKSLKQTCSSFQAEKINPMELTRFLLIQTRKTLGQKQQTSFQAEREREKKKTILVPSSQQDQWPWQCS